MVAGIYPKGFDLKKKKEDEGIILTFGITKKQLHEINTWLKKHNKKCKFHKNSGSIGGRLSYVFTPTGVGECLELKCACGKELDLTDYSEW